MESSDHERSPGSDPLDIEETAMIGDERATVAGPSSAVCLPGDQFGRYRIVKTLGEGSMGSVYLAHDTQLDRKVALKIPKFDTKSDSKLIDRFLREARSAATLSHPNICSVYDVGEIDGTHFMTMAYIQGHTLSEFITPDKKQPDRNIANVIRKIALAVNEAHVNGLVHRDVKPGNIMIDQRNEPIIMDFGLARQVDESDDARLTRDGAILGSPAYMSPEQIEGQPDKIGPASDIYSLGVILYELTTSRLPFEGSVVLIIGQILSQEPPSPLTHRPDLNPKLADICLKAMAKKPEERFSSMQAMANALMEFMKNPGAEPKKAVDNKAKPHRPAPAKPDTIEVTCDCGKKLVGGKEMAGKTVRCPECHATVLLPGGKEIRVKCQCGQRFMADASLAGRAVRCPMCQQPLTVPQPGVLHDESQIAVRCGCGQEFLASATLSGKEVACTACGSRIIVPHSNYG